MDTNFLKVSCHTSEPSVADVTERPSAAEGEDIGTNSNPAHFNFARNVGTVESNAASCSTIFRCMVTDVRTSISLINNCTDHDNSNNRETAEIGAHDGELPIPAAAFDSSACRRSAKNPDNDYGGSSPASGFRETDPAPPSSRISLHNWHQNEISNDNTFPVSDAPT